MDTATYFFIFIGMVIYHFIYEAILLPSIRSYIRLKLFKLRDELRRIKLEYNGVLDNKLMHGLQNSININVNRLQDLDFIMVIVSYKEVSKNENLKEYLEEQQALLAQCNISEIKVLYKEKIKLMVLTLFANSGAWIIYVFPFFIFLLISLLVEVIRQWFKNQAKNLVFMPDKYYSDINLQKVRTTNLKPKPHAVKR